MKILEVVSKAVSSIDELNSSNFRGVNNSKLELGMLIFDIQIKKEYMLVKIPEVGTELKFSDSEFFAISDEQPEIEGVLSGCWYLVNEEKSSQNVYQKFDEDPINNSNPPKGFLKEDPTTWKDNTWNTTYPGEFKTTDYIWKLNKWGFRSTYNYTIECIREASDLKDTSIYLIVYRNSDSIPNPPEKSKIEEDNYKFPPNNWVSDYSSLDLTKPIWQSIAHVYTTEDSNGKTLYIRSFVDNSDWSTPIRITGEDGNNIEFIYLKSKTEISSTEAKSLIDELNQYNKEDSLGYSDFQKKIFQ